MTATIDPTLLDRLTQANYHVVLWTTSTIESDIWEKFLPHIDHVCLYAPAITPAVFQEITGYYPFIPLESTITLLTEIKMPFTLNHLFHLDSISELLELYGLASKHKAHLFIHYHEKESIDPESKDYLNWFKNTPNTMVFKRSHSAQIQCLGFPFHQHPKRLAKIKDLSQLLMYHLNQWGNPQFLLKKLFG